MKVKAFILFAHEPVFGVSLKQKSLIRFAHSGLFSFSRLQASLVRVDLYVEIYRKVLMVVAGLFAHYVRS